MLTKRVALLALVSALLVAATAAGIGAYAIYDARNEIHRLQARVQVVGEQSERAARAARALCAGIAGQRKNPALDLRLLARLTRSECAPLLRLPPPR